MRQARDEGGPAQRLAVQVSGFSFIFVAKFFTNFFHLNFFGFRCKFFYPNLSFVLNANFFYSSFFVLNVKIFLSIFKVCFLKFFLPNFLIKFFSPLDCFP